MPMTTCRECGEPVSTEAWSCPHCGAPDPAGQGRAIRGAFPWWRWSVEWKSQATLFGYPWVHIAIGYDGPFRPKVARGIIAIGQFAVGVVAIAQFGVGLLCGLGQFILSPVAVAQFAIGLLFGLGQIATGYVAVGQVALGYYALSQIGAALHMWSPGRRDAEAIHFFRSLAESVGLLGGER